MSRKTQSKASRTLLWTIEEASRQFNCSRESLRRGLRNLGLDTPKGGTFTVLQHYQALTGDLKIERTREARARADLLELERREKERELVPLGEVQSMIMQTLGAVRERIATLPAVLASRCNRLDPAHARAALKRWADETLKVGREFAGKVKP